MQNLCFGPECTSGYRSCKVFILLHWTRNDVWGCFRAFRKPSARKKMQNLCFGPGCAILGYRSCKVSILLQWTQNDVSECFRAFRYPSARKRCKTCVSGLNALFRGTEAVKYSFYSIGRKMMFGGVSEHFANLRHVK
jgi:hypothetical protein